MRIRSVPELGLIIRERRRKLGLGQRALAAKVGVSRQWIVEVEQGKARAAVGLLLRTLAASTRQPHSRRRPSSRPRRSRSRTP